MNAFLAMIHSHHALASAISDANDAVAGVGIVVGTCVLVVFFFLKLWKALTANIEIARSQEKIAKSQQDTVYLLRELVTLLKKQQKSPPETTQPETHHFE